MNETTFESEMSALKKRMIVASKNLKEAREAEAEARKNVERDPSFTTRKALRLAIGEVEKMDEAEEAVARAIADFSRQLKQSCKEQPLVTETVRKHLLAELNGRLIRGF